ncbi:MAG: hypothetical protein KC731_30645 [Myxococcales bacterium]|nr:hypothetical protein [Myxococcales bacterium]
MSITHDFSFAALLAAAALSPTFGAGTGVLTAQDREAPLVDRVLEANDWRELGPVNFAGRIIDIEADPNDRFTFYAVSATGGIWKTVNNGTTFDSVFEVPGVFSIGDLAVAPSDPNVLYVGTVLDGMAISHNGGVSFAPFATELGDVDVRAIDVTPQGLAISTHGHGVLYEAPTTPGTGGGGAGGEGGVGGAGGEGGAGGTAVDPAGAGGSTPTTPPQTSDRDAAASCGCRIGQPSFSGASWLFALALGLGLGRRRRARR